MKKNEPNFTRENLSDDEMIVYAELDAEINLTDFDNFEKNFEVLKLEKKVEKLQHDLEGLQSKHGRLMVHLEDIIEPLIDIHSKISLDRHSAIRYLDVGDFFLNCGDCWLAMEYYEKAKKIESTINVDVKYLRMIDQLTRAINQNPNDASAYADRGYAYDKLKKYDEAISDYTQAIKLNPNGDYLYSRRAHTYEAIGEIEKAKQDLAKADELRRRSGW